MNSSRRSQTRCGSFAATRVKAAARAPPVTLAAEAAEEAEEAAAEEREKLASRGRWSV